MQPNLALFFVVMALFCAAAVALQEYILAVAEGCATLLLLGCYQWLSVRRRRALAEYVQATSEMLQHTSDGEMPFPVALVKLNDNELVWYNRAFAELTHVRERMSAQSLSEVIPGLSADFLAAGKQEAAAELRFEGRRYRVSGTVMPDADPKSGVMLGMLYLLDLTDLLLVRDEYIRSRPIVSIVLVDNYDELTNNMPDVSISALNAQLNSRISDWADSFGGMLRKLERNRFLLLFEAKDLARMADGKFSLLESVRSVTSPTGIPATVSIGIGKDGVDFREDYDFAALSIEMALSRGGDQAVLNMHEPFASSASELVTELLQYAVDATDILPQEAAALLAGIVLDTKNFGVRTSSRTFEAAAFLRRIGADTVAVKKLFQNDLSATVARYRIIQNARLYRGSIAIAALDYTVTRTLAAQAADELLNISGIDTSFVLYPQDGVTYISARSLGDANVQVILEPLGGGGNAATAGAQVKNHTVQQTLDELLQSINKFYES